jgi:hypothetical protein
MRRAVTLVLILAAWLPGAGPAVADAPDAAPAKRSAERLDTLNDDLAGLLVSVAAGDDGAKRRLAARIHDGLQRLDERLRNEAGAALTVGDGRAALVSLHPGLDAEAIAQALSGRVEGPQLEALRRNAVGPLAYPLDAGETVYLRYYPPAQLYVASDRARLGEWETPRAASGPGAQAGEMRRRLAALEGAWDDADRLAVAVGDAVAARWGLPRPLPMGYLPTGVVSPRAVDADDALLEEIRRQLEYVVNAKVEGPPLLAAMRANLFLGEQFGFGAWGGRWPEFADKVFMLRYDPPAGRFLVRVRSMPGARLPQRDARPAPILP